MSTLLYESLTNARESARGQAPLKVEAPKKDGTQATKSVPKLVDTVAALVPAEVLAAHAALFGAVSTVTDPGEKGPVVATVTDPAWATRFWWALLVVATLLYAVPHAVKHGWDRWDLLRTFVPPGAFAAWSMLQKATLFDAVADWSNLARVGIGVFIGLAALIVGKSLAEKAQEKDPSAEQAASFP